MTGLDQWDWREVPASELQYLDDDQRLKYLMGQRCSEAIALARQQYGIDLDLTLGSIDQLENILNRLFVARSGGCFAAMFSKPRSSGGLRELARPWAAYLGELVRLQLGGGWTTELSNRPSQPGEYFSIREIEFDPGDEVCKHLQNGANDSVRGVFYNLMERTRG